MKKLKPWAGWDSLPSLVRRFFPHRHGWETTHTNQWMIPTRQVCRCGAERWKKSDPRPIEGLQHIGGGNWPRMTYRWEYSDGTHGPWRRMTNDSIIPANDQGEKSPAKKN